MEKQGIFSVEPSCSCFSGLQAAVVGKMIGRIDRMRWEAMVLIGFQTFLFFQPKNGWKGNFLWKNREFSLWSLRVVVSAGLQAAVVGKMMGRIGRMLLQAMILIGFPTFVFFQPKKDRKGNFLCGAFVFLFQRAFKLLWWVK